MIWDLALDNASNRVYTVGRNSGTLFTADKTTGATVFKNVGSVNGDSQAVTLAPNGRVYVGGHFVTIQGQTRMLVAEFDVSGKTPVLGPFSAKFVTSYPGVWALASTGSRLYVGGDFTQAGSLKKFPYFAMFGDASADATAPTAALSPANGATNVAAATNVTATFSEPVQGVDGSSFTLRQSGAAAGVSAVVSYNATTRVATLDPAADLAAGATYTATLGSAIRDAAGNPLAPTTCDLHDHSPTRHHGADGGGHGPGERFDHGAAGHERDGDVQRAGDGRQRNELHADRLGGGCGGRRGRPGTGNAWILDPTADLAAGTRTPRGWAAASWTAPVTPSPADTAGASRRR